MEAKVIELRLRHQTLHAIKARVLRSIRQFHPERLATRTAKHKREYEMNTEVNHRPKKLKNHSTTLVLGNWTDYQ